MARDEGNWARQGRDLQVGEMPAEAINLGLQGRSVNSPIQGFGKMWQKTYKITLEDEVSPQEVIRVWKSEFPTFWPEGNKFFGPLTGIAPGDVAVLNLKMPGGVKLSTGVLVLYADDESFTLMTPEGHMLAGWITFSAFVKDGKTIVQAQVLMRAGDPFYELGLAFGGHRKEDRFWEHTLHAVARRFGAEGTFEMVTLCVDKKRQWRRAGNIRKSAFIRSAVYATGAPVRLLSRPFRKGKKAAPPATDVVTESVVEAAPAEEV